jgi:hypothetical protein
MINPLLHKQPVALDRNDHRFMRLRRPIVDWSAASRLNAVFVAAVEFGDVAREYPIVFVRAGNGEDGQPDIAPLAMLGLRVDSNLYVDGGHWRARYQPAVVRMYPFAVGRLNKDSFAVCFDATCTALSGTEGDPMFGADGEPTAFVKEVLAQLETLEAEIQRTQRMCRVLREMDLLQEMRYDATLADGSQLAVDGFLTVNDAKLNALTDAQTLQLHRSGILGMVHAHYVSMGHMGKLLDWHGQRLAALAPAAT